jgi:response regulator of citrate/malate metabolism
MSLTQASRPGVAGRATEREGEPDPEPEELLALLNAEYTQAILTAIQTEAKAARTLAEECNASRATVYRRLNRLQEAGLVDSDMVYDADGHHRAVFETTLDAIRLDVTASGLSASVMIDGAD